jgi:hypothetical protein
MQNSEKRVIKTIDCTPTWEFAMSVYIASIIQHGYEAKQAIADLMELAKHVDNLNKN